MAMGAKTYSQVLILVLLASVAFFSGVSFILQPLSGDLTRIGWYSERDFGWNAPQRRFPTPLYDFGNQGGYHDVVVVGDSFSGVLQPGHGVAHADGVRWQNFFVALTGLSLLTLDTHIGDFDPATYTENAVFKRNPPRLFVLEIVERSLRYRFGGRGSGCGSDFSDPGIPNTARMKNTGEALEEYSRETGGMKTINPGYGKRFLLHALRRNVFGIDLTDVVRLGLAKNDLFSSRSSGELLVHRDDLKKQGWTPGDVAAIRCGILRFKEQITRNGKTRFLLMIAPDKLTAYEDLISERNRIAKLSRLAEIIPSESLSAIRLDQIMKQAVRKGIKDIYLPNDTHWGWEGYQLAAESVARAAPLPGDAGPDVVRRQPVPRPAGSLTP